MNQWEANGMQDGIGFFIGGRWRTAGEAGEPLINPASGETIGFVPHAGPALLDEALAEAQAAFAVWRDWSAHDRGLVIGQAAALLRQRRDRVAALMAREQGKPLREGRGEVDKAADVIAWYAEEGRRAYGRIIPARTPGTTMSVTLEPVGPVAAFTPWNFPVLTPARKIAGALAAGCSIILKASEEAPGTAMALVDCFREAGLPDGVLNLVFGVPADVSAHLLDSPIIRKVSFTGSVPVGRLLAARAAQTLKSVTMELGGHAPVVVCADASLETAVRLGIAGKFRNAGQVCVAPTRFFVHASRYDAFVDAFTRAAAALAVGDPLDEGTQMGPLSNERRLVSTQEFVADARRRGARITTGGSRIGNRGFFHEPTVLADCPEDALAMVVEPFGPIAPIVSFEDIEDAIARANSLPFGLAAYAFTESASLSGKLAASLRSGMVAINSLDLGLAETPFGGVGDSGYGREGGVEGLHAYMESKFVVAHHGM